MRGVGLSSPLGQGTVCAFREALSFDAEGMVEPRTVVLPCDGGREFDELRLIKMLSQRGEKLVRHLDGRLRHGYAVVKHQLLKRGKYAALFVCGEFSKLLFRDAGCSADGRADVDSKRAAH